MADPIQPYPVSGKIYDIDSTAEGGVSVKATNVRTGESIMTATNSSGEYTLDLANLSSGYNTSDIIFMQAWKFTSSTKKIQSATFVVEGDSKELDLYLRGVFRKRVIDASWNDINQETHGFEFGVNKVMSIDADRTDMTYDSSGNVTQIVEYIQGVKVTTNLTWESGNCTRIEVV